MGSEPPKDAVSGTPEQLVNQALIETFRWEPATGFVRLDRHLNRMARSAAALGFRFDRPRVVEAIDAAVGGPSPLRVRLALSADSRCEAVAATFVPLPADATWRLKIAATRLSSADPLLAHKTTCRGLYETARAEYAPEEADEVLLLNEEGAVCEGTITNVFARFDGGRLRTPAAASGLLPGILREQLIEQGEAEEALLAPADLLAAKEVFVGNSLRGLIRADLE